eukprot:m.35312 g.35312  ORF g.35312 m.35312 type:complete len:89 (-) comp5308_c0_seq2:167-433(-)
MQEPVFSSSSDGADGARQPTVLGCVKLFLAFAVPLLASFQQHPSLQPSISCKQTRHFGLRFTVATRPFHVPGVRLIIGALHVTLTCPS